MDLGLLYQALEQRKVDMAAGNSTDAQLAGNKIYRAGATIEGVSLRIMPASLCAAVW